MNMVSGIVLSGAGVTFLLFIAARLLPNERVKAMGVTAGKAVSAFGAGKLGKVFYEKIEDFIQNSSAVFFAGMKEGLDSDDQQTK